jgi:multidrug resistance efflux pump
VLLIDEQTQPDEVAWRAESLAVILDLVAKLATARNLRAGCHLVVDELPAHLGCRQIALGLIGFGGRCRLRAISGMRDFDRRAELPQVLEAKLQAVAESTSMLIEDEPGTIAAPLRLPTGEVIGAWLFMGDAAFAIKPANQRFIAAAGESIAAELHGLQQRRRSILPTRQGVGRRWRLKSLAVLATLLAAAAMWLPLQYRIACECELQPATRRFIAAPFAGVFEKSLVEPGDVVTRDQVLARMDGTEIRCELATLTAEQQRAAKAHDVNLAAGKVAAAQIDRLEFERLDQKRQLLAQRSLSLEIKSPLTGIVLSGDLKRSEGVPVTVGQKLYEVAPLEEMIVEVVIPDTEIPLAVVGQEVEVRLDAFPGRVWQGWLARVHPRSEVRDEQNIFVAEVRLPNEGLQWRPGMKGRAKIASGPQRLGWILLHEPLNRCAAWLGW